MEKKLQQFCANFTCFCNFKMPKILQHALRENLLWNQAFEAETIPNKNPQKIEAVSESMLVKFEREDHSWSRGRQFASVEVHTRRALEAKRSLNSMCLSTDKQLKSMMGELCCMKHKSFYESVIYSIVSTEKHISFKIHVIILKYKVLQWLLWRAASVEQWEHYYQAHLCAQYWFEFL